MLAPVSSQNSRGWPLTSTDTTGVPNALRRMGSTTGTSGTTMTGTGTFDSARPHRSTPACAAVVSVTSALSGSEPSPASAGQSERHESAIVSPMRARVRTF